MFFIFVLIATTVAIAGSAAYFSVYGLANTFSGTFWSVVIMGGALEAGKLVSASYLYRYWDRLGKWGWFLKFYMIAGILTLMFLTSAGIFGYLSSGYQADVLPLKQRAEQITLLDEERTRSLTRKRQIDEQISKGAIISNVERKDGTIDPRAAAALREATRSRESTANQFKAEQGQLQKRIAELDKELLQLRTEQIKTEAHIGPITYIAKAFNYDTDVATKYLIFLIIFAFDPMAVALTLGVNIALRLREQDTTPPPAIVQPAVASPPPPPAPIVMPTVDTYTAPPQSKAEVIISRPVEPSPSPKFVLEEPIVEPEPVIVPEPEPVVSPPPPPPAPRVVSIAPRPEVLSMLRSDIPWSARPNQDSINQLISYYRELKTREPLSGQDLVDQNAIENILRRHGLMIYLEQ